MIIIIIIIIITIIIIDLLCFKEIYMLKTKNRPFPSFPRPLY